ncbi:MAG: redoxin domain-containing protein [Bryobacteraceae bacterium]
MTTLAVFAAALALLGAPGKVDVIKATDLQGKPVEIQTAGKITAVIFISTQCPISNDYNERMKALYNEFHGKGVQFIFLNANSTESSAEVAEHARKHAFPFTVYKDVNNVEADRFSAEFTPHVFVIGKNSEVIYRGAIDDSRPADKVTKTYLRDVLNAALAGKPLPVTETKAFGCTIKRVKKST